MSTSDWSQSVELETEQWRPLVDRVAPGYDIVTVMTPRGSFSNTTTLLTLRGKSLSTLSFAVKTYAGGKADSGAYARREHAALELLRSHRIPAPTPVFLDTEGATLPSPGIVTEALQGAPSLDYRNDPTQVRELAETLARVHSIQPPDDVADLLLRSNDEALYFLLEPKWRGIMASHPKGDEVFRLCQELRDKVRPGSRRLTHLDFWSGNLLWRRSGITGIVDWEEAAVGDPLYDLAYFQLDLRNVGGENLVDAFSEIYIDAADYDIDPRRLAFFQLAASARAMPDPADGLGEARALGDTWSSPESLRRSLDVHINRAVAHLER